MEIDPTRNLTEKNILCQIIDEKQAKIIMQKQMEERKKKLNQGLPVRSSRASRASSPNILFRNWPSSLHLFMKKEKLGP